MKFFRKMFFLLFLVAGLGITYFCFDLRPVKAHSLNDLIINEFFLGWSGDQWIEVLNTTDNVIDLTGWELVVTEMNGDDSYSGAPNTSTLSGLVPAKGLLVLSGSGLMYAEGAPAGLFMQIVVSNTLISAVSYGYHVTGVPYVNKPDYSVSESAMQDMGNWSVTTSISRGWYNITTSTLDCDSPPVPGPGVTPPSLAAIATCLPSGVESNMTDSNFDPTNAQGLYFYKEGMGEIVLNQSTFNITDQNSMNLLQNLKTKLELDGGRIALDASTAILMRDAGAEIYFYGLKDLGYNNIDISSIIVRDDSGNIIPTSSPDYPEITGVNWYDTNTGTLQFNTEHFSGYETIPLINEITPVSSTVNTNTPTYVFGTNVTGTYQILGDCATGGPASTTNGQNIIILGPLTDGVYNNCYVKVVDGANNSSTLLMSSFTVDTLAPQVNTTTPNPTCVGAGAVGSSTFSFTVLYNKPMDQTVTPTISFEPPLWGVLTESSRSYSWVSSTAFRLVSDVNGNQTGDVVTSATAIVLGTKDLNGTYTATQTIPNSFLVDFATSSPPVIDSVNGSTTSPQTSSNANPVIVISGLNVDDTIKIYNGASEIDSVIATATTMIRTLSLSEGSYTLTVKAVDLCGNISDPSNSMVYILNTTPPPAPTINQINGSASTTQYSTDPNLEIYIGGYGTSTPDYIEVYGSSTLLLTYTPTTAPSVATTTLSSEGSWNIYAKSIKDGLTSTDSNVYVYNYDITKPQVLSAVGSPDPFTSADTTTTITVVFNEPVDTSVDPNVSIQNDIVINKISFTSTTWIGTASLSGVTFDGTSPIVVTGTVDLAGNMMNDNLNAGTFVLNTIAPTIFINDDVSATAVTSDSVRFWIMDGDVDTSTLYYGFKTDNSCDASVSYIYQYGNNIAFTITSSVNNGKYICAKAADIYGNTRYQASTNPLNIVGYAGVNTLEATGLDYTGATLNGEITALGGMNATHRGFYYGTSNPYSNFAITSGSYGLGSFTHALTSLSAGTVYQFIAMASNTAGITTGTTKTFITYFEPSTSTPTSTIDSTYISTTTIPVPTDVTNSVLDMTSLESGGSVTTPGPVVVNASTSIGLVKLEIPDDTTISGTGWDGNLILPTIKENSSVNVTADSGKTASVNTVVEIGFGDTALTFDKAVRILIPGMGGKDAGYYRGTSFYKISATCSADTQTVGNALAAGADCKITVGGDLVIWTKHFTKFIAYTQTSIPSSGGGGGAPIVIPVLGTTPVAVSGGNTVKTKDITLLFNVNYATMVAISEKSDFSDTAWGGYSASQAFKLSEGYGNKVLYVKFRSATGGEISTQLTINYVTSETVVPIVSTGTTGSQTTISTDQGFTFNFRAGLTEKQKQSIINLVDSGRLFSQTDARNYAWAVGINDWQQFVGKNPKTIVVAGEVSSHYVFTKYLGIGSVGNDVKALQQILKELGYFTYPYVTSYYGSITKEAVVNYQKAKGLTPYPGHVGPATRAALNAE